MLVNTAPVWLDDFLGFIFATSVYTSFLYFQNILVLIFSFTLIVTTPNAVKNLEILLLLLLLFHNFNHVSTGYWNSFNFSFAFGAISLWNEVSNVWFTFAVKLKGQATPVHVREPVSMYPCPLVEGNHSLA